VSIGTGPTLAAAAASGADLLWVLQDGLTAAPDALERLVAAAQEPDAPAVLAGLVVDAAGAPVERLVPRGSDVDLDALVALAPRRRLAIRFARGGHVLVRREMVDAHGLPDERSFGPYALAEWSARALEGGVGWLLPDSVATLERPDALPGRRALRALPAALRAARRARWTPGQTAVVLGEFVRASGR
jgi:GT2 family glycosyltransferase